MSIVQPDLLSLLNFDSPAPHRAPAPASVYADQAALEDIAFLYTATEAGTNSGIRFAATVEDARKWCRHPASRGTLHGTAWAYFWTSAWNFAHAWNDFTGTHRQGTPLVVSIEKLTDSGAWDARIAAAGVKKIPLTMFREVLEPLGVTVVGEPRMGIGRAA